MELAFQTVEGASKLHPKPSSKTFSYGTAGFRGKADGLDCVMFRMGLLAVLRSKAKSGKDIGVVITASHNPVDDNGVKLVDPLGEMLEESWEKYATKLANAEAGELVAVLREVVSETVLDFASSASVAIARDTRPSGEELVKSLIDGIVALSGRYYDYGEFFVFRKFRFVCFFPREGRVGGGVSLVPRHSNSPILAGNLPF